MYADLRGALEQIKTSWTAFQHRGKRMEKHEVEAVLRYGIGKGYKSTAQFSDEELFV